MPEVDERHAIASGRTTTIRIYKTVEIDGKIYAVTCDENGKEISCSAGIAIEDVRG